MPGISLGLQYTAVVIISLIVEQYCVVCSIMHSQMLKFYTLFQLTTGNLVISDASGLCGFRFVCFCSLIRQLQTKISKYGWSKKQFAWESLRKPSWNFFQWFAIMILFRNIMSWTPNITRWKPKLYLESWTYLIMQNVTLLTPYPPASSLCRNISRTNWLPFLH